MHPGDIEDRLVWAQALDKKVLKDHVSDYRKGSNDPAAVDAFYEFLRRLDQGKLKGKPGDYRCGSHQRRKGRPRKCANCEAEFEDAKQRFPKFFGSTKKGKRNDAAHDGVTGD